MRPWVLGVLVLAAAVVAAGCHNEPKVPPKVEQDRGIDSSDEMWEPMGSKDGDEFLVREKVRVVDTLKNAEIDCRHACYSKAVDMAAKDYIQDMAKYDANADEIHRRIKQQPNKFIKRSTVLETRTLENDTQYGMYMKVLVDDQALKNVLQELGIIRQHIAEKQAIIVVYGGKNVEKNLVAKVGRKLGEYYNVQGYNAILWDEVATDIAEERNVGERATEDFIQKFVENPEFQGDTEYQGTLTALRSRGRLVIAFNVNKVGIVNRTVSVSVHAFAKDLLTGRIIADEEKPSSRLLAGDADRDVAIHDAVYKASEELSASLLKKTNNWYDKLEVTKVGTEYTFKFSGFTEDEVQQIDRQWRQTFSAGGDGNMEGSTYVRTYTGEEKGQMLCDKVDMMMKKAGLSARKPMPDSRATTFEFKKK
ncbi:MAG: hypothetical protein HYY18_08640 [Planctomycetes bacterium]|nr:hypothetical protein [Planctomycetota bacterium]